MPESQPAAPPEQLPAAVGNPALPASVEEAREVADSISRGLRRAARKARAPAGLISGGGGVRARRGDRAFRLSILASFIACVIVPLAVESVYWGLIASKQYATEAKFTIQAGQASPLDTLGGLFGLGASQTAQDTEIVAQYIKSRTMVEALDRALDMRRIYSRDDVDYFSRFDHDDPIEDLEKYWNKRVTVKIENLSRIVDVSVRAFTPQDSLALTNKVLSLSEAIVNDLSNRSRRDALAQSLSELERSEKRLKEATAAMRDARNAQHVLDAKSAAESIEKIVSVLRLERAKLEQDLAAQPGVASDSPHVRIIRARIASIQKQIEDYSNKIASAGGTSGNKEGSLANRLGLLSRKQVDLDLARQQYAQASAVYQNARVNLETQQVYLVTSMRPTLAQESTYPRRWWEWSIIVFPALLIWAILVAIAFLVRDNMAK